MRLLKTLKAFVGYGRCTYLEILLREIEVMKEIFILDVEQGDEISIPMQLKQSNLSISYRFYDPVMALIDEQISREMKDYFVLKNKLNIQRL